MKIKRSFASILLAFVATAAACYGAGSGETDVDAPPWEGGTDDCLGHGCNPFAPAGQQGCQTGEKCTWIRVQETPERIGKLACAPDGTVGLGGACTFNVQDGGGGGHCEPLRDMTGYDNCAAGLYCIADVCREVCGFDGSSNAACPSDQSCTRYEDTFSNGPDDDPIAGICNPRCDPLTQTKTGTNPPETCGEGQGCYLLTSQTDTIAVCAIAGTATHNADLSGPYFANSCVPGAQPRRKDQASTTVQCGGLCRVVDVRMGVNEASEGGEVTGSTTDKDNCQATWGAAPPSDGTAGESCRYWWSREPFEALSPYSNTVGWCFKHAAFRYDTNLDLMPDTLFPRCTEVTQSDTLLPTNGQPDDLYFWCRASPPPMLAGAVYSIKKWQARIERRLDRVMDWSRVP